MVSSMEKFTKKNQTQIHPNFIPGCNHESYPIIPLKKCKLCIFWNWFLAKIILISQKKCFKAIQNGSKLNRVLQTQIAICHQIFAG